MKIARIRDLETDVAYMIDVHIGLYICKIFTPNLPLSNDMEVPTQNGRNTEDG